jgi:hypothetical protein
MVVSLCGDAYWQCGDRFDVAPGENGDGALGKRGAQAQGRGAVSVGSQRVAVVYLDRGDDGGSNGTRFVMWQWILAVS